MVYKLGYDTRLMYNVDNLINVHYCKESEGMLFRHFFNESKQ